MEQEKDISGACKTDGKECEGTREKFCTMCGKKLDEQEIMMRKPDDRLTKIEVEV